MSKLRRVAEVKPKKSAVRCPKCGSRDIQYNVIEGMWYIGVWKEDDSCRDCGHHFNQREVEHAFSFRPGPNDPF